MQMVSICVCITYADVRHMDMHDLYAFFSFSAEIRKKVKSEPALILAGLCQNSEWKKVESHLQTLHDLLTKWSELAMRILLLNIKARITNE